MDIAQIGTVKFQTCEYLEDDDCWSALFVKIEDGQWHMAYHRYNTEDISEIIEILKTQNLI